MSTPVFVFKVAGSTYDHVAHYVQFDALTLYRKDSWSSFSWSVPGGALVGATDPFLGKSITLDIDAGLGGISTRRFTGRCVDCEVAFGVRGDRKSVV